MFCICDEETVKLDCDHEICIECIKKFIYHLGHLCPICTKPYTKLKIINTREEFSIDKKLDLIENNYLNKYIIFYNNLNKNKIKTRLHQRYLTFEILSGPNFRKEKILESFNNSVKTILMINKKDYNNNKHYENIIKINI